MKVSVVVVLIDRIYRRLGIILTDVFKFVCSDLDHDAGLVGFVCRASSTMVPPKFEDRLGESIT